MTNLYGSSNTDKNPSATCNNIETQMHMFVCNCGKQKEIQETLLPTIEKHLTKTKVPLAFRSALKSGIRHFLYALSTENPEEHPIPTWTPNPYNSGGTSPQILRMISQAYTSQSAIGWRHLLQGRLSTEWSRVYCFIRKYPFPSIQGDMWCRKLIIAIWRVVLNLWAQRCSTNGKLVTDLEESNAILQREQTEDTIRQAYTQGRYCTHPEDHSYLFQTPINTLLSGTYSSLTLWLDTYNSAKNKWQQHLDGRINNPVDRGPTQTTLHAYFHALSPGTQH